MALDVARSWRSTRNTSTAAFLVAAVVGSLGIVSGLPPHQHLTDFGVYRRAAHAMARGIDIYSVNGSRFSFTYPPFAAQFVLPLTAVPVAVAAALMTALTLGAALFVVHASLAPARPTFARAGRWAWTIAPLLSVALLWTEPVRVTAWLGQINAILLALVVADVSGVLRRLPRGVLTGIAVGVKLTPGMFLLAALAARRYRAALVGGGVFAATVALGALVQPHAARQYWTGLLWNTDRVGQVRWYGNQSLLGVLTRLLGDGPATRLSWIVASLVVVVVGIRAAVRLAATGNRMLAVGLVGVLSTLVSPISWTHHWVWCIPVFGGLLARAGGSQPAINDPGRAWAARVGAGLWLGVFEVGPNTRFAHLAFGWTPSRVLVGNDYVIAGLVLLAVLARRTGSSRPVDDGAGSGRLRLTES